MVVGRFLDHSTSQLLLDSLFISFDATLAKDLKNNLINVVCDSLKIRILKRLFFESRNIEGKLQSLTIALKERQESQTQTF